MRRSALVLLALTLAACGDEGNGLSAEDTVREYLAAEKAADGKKLCGLYSNDYRGLIDDETDGSCEDGAASAAKLSQDERNELVSVEESGDEATATVTCEDPTASDCSLALIKEDGSWKVDGSLSPND